jgi:hypothetical protein
MRPCRASSPISNAASPPRRGAEHRSSRELPGRATSSPANALRAAAEESEATLRQELDAIEASLAPIDPKPEPAAPAPDRLAGRALLYVGGRPNQVSHIRALAEGVGVQFLHHDGGIDDRSGLLAGLVGRADIVMFPVDCVSHEAAGIVKRLCRQTAKPYLALRSTAASSFIAALGRPDIAELHLG